MKIEIKYFNDSVEKIGKISVGDWCDLRCSENISLKAGEFALIKLGVAMKLPKNYEANVVPRSSTFKKWGIIQTNSYGVIDNSYCGDNDEWMMPVLATKDVEIELNDRVCQFRINKNQPKFTFKTVEKLSKKSRGGFGSTGTK